MADLHEPPHRLELGFIARPVDHDDRRREHPATGQGMQLGPPSLDRVVGDLARQYGVEAAIRGAVQVSELVADHECLRRPER